MSKSERGVILIPLRKAVSITEARREVLFPPGANLTLQLRRLSERPPYLYSAQRRFNLLNLVEHVILETYKALRGYCVGNYSTSWYSKDRLLKMLVCTISCAGRLFIDCEGNSSLQFTYQLTSLRINRETQL